MDLLMLVVFVIGLSLLLVHEMDAIRSKEWKMFIGLRSIEERVAYRLFALFHIPLYCAALLLLLSEHYDVGWIIVDVFLIAHALVHVVFRKHKENQFDAFSYSIIYAAGACGLLHLVLFLTPYFT